MSDVEAEVAALRTEVKYLKIIIPAGCGLVALLVLIFWGIERQNIGARVHAALNQEGIESAIIATTKAREKAESDSKHINELRQTLPWFSIEVLSIDHKSGKVGQYFNFDIEVVDKAVDSKDWNNKNFLVINSRTMQIAPAVLWNQPNGGSMGSGHGRWASGASGGQWKVGDKAIVVYAPAPQ